MAFVYSCCFWFSLRLGGILIGMCSTLQGVLIMIACGVAQAHSQELRNQITWINEMNLIYTKDFLNTFKAEPQKFLTILIILTCLYTALSMMYIYGAYMCNNSLMVGYILVEFLRLVALSLVVVTWLLILKQNTMDIGLLIWTSVVGGFFLLGMFYLWVCAANLPVLINEMERDEQVAIIDKLQDLLESNNTQSYVHGYEQTPLPLQNRYTVQKTIKKNKMNYDRYGSHQNFMIGQYNLTPYYQ